MSVWATLLHLDDEDDHSPAPVRCCGSHHVPSSDDPRGGHLDVAGVPGHVTRDDRDDQPTGEELYWPHLRLIVGAGPRQAGTVVLDAAQVDALIEALTFWRSRIEGTSTPPSGRADRPEPAAMIMVDRPDDAGFVLARLTPSDDLAPDGWDAAVENAGGSHVVFGESADAVEIFARNAD